jgi:lysophospholipase L1-like esterase
MSPLGYQPKLINDLNALNPPHLWREATPRIATGGWRVDELRTGVLANIASVTPTPDYALINIGVNDTSTWEETSETLWKADMQDIIDAIHGQFPLCQIYIMRVWARSRPNCAVINGWISDLVTINSNTHLGPDESVFLENGDDGATYTTDGGHPTEPAGYQLTANQWRSVLGY